MIMTVGDIFQLEGRGTVLTGSILPDSPPVRKGDAIELHTPQGVCIANSVVEIEFFRGANPRAVGLLLASPLTLEDLPRGSEVRHVGPA